MAEYPVPEVTEEMVTGILTVDKVALRYSYNS